MPLRIVKLFVSASTATTTTAGPTVTKFFYETTVQTAAGSTLTIAVGSFEDDTGAAATTVPAGSDPIEAQTPIRLEVVNYDPQSSSTTTVTT